MADATFDIHSEFGELLSEDLRDWLGCCPIDHVAKLVSAITAEVAKIRVEMGCPTAGQPVAYK
ncbi:MAG: hypothetical protein U5S82_16810 [Gammaproteobacteria bacterium]|nr:hypothetical protein [Gammaproteobacteria bacterium]